MKKYKYVGCSGLAFAGAEQDLRKLEGLALQGWVLVGFAFGGFCYKLERSEPVALAYDLDFFEGKKKEREDYLETFKNSGWSPAVDLKPYTIFKAPYGTAPVFFERNNHEEKSHNQTVHLLKGFLVCVVAFLAFRFGMLHFFPRLYVPRVALEIFALIGLVFTGLPLLATMRRNR